MLVLEAQEQNIENKHTVPVGLLEIFNFVNHWTT